MRVPPWAGWFVGRCLSGLATALALSVLVFIATQALPSDPARVILGPDATDESVAILTRQLGLDLPLPEQYGKWLGRVLSGDFGKSMSSRREVGALVAARANGTLSLIAVVMPFSLVTSSLLGVFLAVRRDSWIDRLGVSLLISVKAVPVFAAGIGLVMLFSTTVFAWLPAVSLIDTERSVFAQFDLIVLPCATLAFATVPYLTRLLRASMIEALGSEYVLQARLRGIPEWRLRYLHALPNAMIPAIQGAALTASVMLGGGVVVEVLFNFPGLGSLLNQAVESRDLPIVQAVVLVVGTGVVAINLAADLLSVLLTPKLRTRVAPGRARGKAPETRSGRALARSVDEPAAASPR